MKGNLCASSEHPVSKCLLSKRRARRYTEEAYMWDQLASVHRVLLVPGSLCGVCSPGWFRACVAGTEEALEEGLQRLELGIRYANDTGTG